MLNAEGMNFKVVTMGRPEVDERQPCNFLPTTLRGLLAWIDAQSTLEEPVKQELKKMASAYPNQALSSFRRNFSRHLARARKIVRDSLPLYENELGEEPAQPQEFEEQHNVRREEQPKPVKPQFSLADRLRQLEEEGAFE